MKIFSSIVILVIAGLTAFGQPMERREADSLLRLLSNTKPGVERIDLLLNLAQYHIFKPGELQKNFDSASTLIKQAVLLNGKLKNKAAEGHIALVESSFDRKNGQRESGQQKVDEAINILKEGINNLVLGQAYFEKSNYYDHDYKDSTIRKRIYFIELAIAAMKQSPDIRNLAFYYFTLGDMHHLISEYAKATDELNLALKYYQLIQYKDLQVVFGLLGRVYYLQGDYELALNYELRALQIAERNKDTTLGLCPILNNLGFIYYKLNDGENALKYFKGSLEIAKTGPDTRTVYLLASNVADAYLKLKMPMEAKIFLDSINSKYAKPKDKIYEAGDYVSNRVYLRLYTALKQFDKAKYYCNQLIQEMKNPRINLSILNSYYVEIIQYYIANSQYSNALNYLRKNQALLDSLKDFVGMARNYNLWFSLDTSQGHYQSAIVDLLKANRANDSVFNQTKSRQLQQLHVQYESDKKETEIKLKDQQIQVLTQKELLQQANLREVNLIKNITIAGIAFILVVLVLLYHQFRNNQKSNKIIFQKNEELKAMLAEKEWWLKEVHHRVKNNLHTIICLLESQAMYLEKDALQAIEKSQHRIYAMSLIHQKLYQNEDIRSIDMAVYLDEFVRYLKDSFDVDEIEFVTKVEPIQLNLSQAIPVGLIINEAVTNSIKYAFTGTAGARIYVSMKETAGIVDLTIADNGKGFVPTEEAETKSLGIQLIKGLSKEIRGSLSIKGDNGTKITIQFKKDIITSTEQVMQKELAGYES
jgi:two-component system, sensor histidine kinase PdtaS